MYKLLCILIVLSLLPTAALAKDYAITVGDKLAVSVADEPDYLTEALVRPDGKITVRNCGEVMARGLTPEQLQEELAKKLRELIRNPIVTVAVTQFANSRIFLVGGGVKPATFDLAQHASLLHLLASIEDMTSADLHSAALVRDGREIKKDLSALYAGDASQDVPLKAGDAIVIPASSTTRGVYVVGAVVTPRMVPYREGMTVLEALLEAGGFTKFASPDHTKVVRKQSNQDEVIKIQAKRLVRDGDLSQNIVLRGGDLIIVEEGFF